MKAFCAVLVVLALVAGACAGAERVERPAVAQGVLGGFGAGAGGGE